MLRHSLGPKHCDLVVPVIDPLKIGQCGVAGRHVENSSPGIAADVGDDLHTQIRKVAFPDAFLRDQEQVSICYGAVGRA